MATATKQNGNRKPPKEVLDWLTATGMVDLVGEIDGPVDSLDEALPILRRPFTPAAVRFKVQSTWPKGNPTNARAVAYIDARLVIERLNLVVGENWKPRYEPTSDGLMWCHLTVCEVERPDVGEGVGKGLVSDSLKRAGVHFGVGVSLYATPKMFFKLGPPGFLKEAKSQNGPTLKLTPKGEDQCRAIYENWLKETGVQKFGKPLDHGDAVEAAGDIETEEDEIERGDGATGESAEGQSGEARAARAEQDRAAEQSQDDSEAAAADPEEKLAELLAKKSTLKDLRVKANEGMTHLGAGPEQRLRELEAAKSTKDLEALIGRINNAMDGGGAE